MDEKKIIILREKSFYGCGITFNVELDGSPVGLLKNGEDISISVSEGPHTISFFKGKKLDANFSIMVSADDEALDIPVKLDRGQHITLSEKAQSESVISSSIKVQKERPYLSNSHGKLQLVGGLSNIPEGSICKVTYNPNRITFLVSGQEFTLESSKMLDVSVMTPTEIQKQYVSSIGGAVAGTVLFGPLGAIIGGSASKKTIKSKRRYLIFTYISDEETTYIVFDVTSSPSIGNNIKSMYRYLKKNENVKIDL